MGAVKTDIEIARKAKMRPIKDILAKSKGSSNPHNLVKATIDALINLRDVNQVAAIRGVSVNKVLNG